MTASESSGIQSRQAPPLHTPQGWGTRALPSLLVFRSRQRHLISPVSRRACHPSFEVACLVEIRKHTGLGWTPSQPFLSQFAGCWVVHRNKGAQKTELFR